MIENLEKIERTSYERISEFPSMIKKNTKTYHIAMIITFIAILQLGIIATKISTYAAATAYANEPTQSSIQNFKIDDVDAGLDNSINNH